MVDKLLATIENRKTQYSNSKQRSVERRINTDSAQTAGVLPKAVNQKLMTKSPSGRTISFDVYVKTRLYKQNPESLVPKTARRTEQEIEFPSSPEEIPRDANYNDKPRTAPGGSRHAMKLQAQT